MALFLRRRFGYQAGMSLVLFAGVLSVSGLIAPGWVREGKKYGGLWMVCQDHLSDCAALDLSDASTTYIFVLAFALFGSLNIVKSCASLVYYNTIATADIEDEEDREKPNRQWFAIAGGICLFIACVLCVIYADDVSSTLDVGPSLVVSVIASLLAVNGGILVTCYYEAIGRETSAIAGTNSGRSYSSMA